MVQFPYIVSPYALVYSDENYYLLAYDEEHNEVRPYRVDRMRDVTQYKGIVRKGQEAFKKIDLAQYQKYSFSTCQGQSNIAPLKTAVKDGRL